VQHFTPNTLSSALVAAIATLSIPTLGAEIAPDSSDNPEMEQVLVRGAYFGQRVASGAKTPTLLLNVPQSISLMTAEQINDQALLSVADVMQYTPGVSIGLGEDHRDQITIRGQNTTADFFVDGLRDDVQYFRPLYNLERVEVLRGSNALLFGRGGGGGVVNRVTKTAQINDSFTEIGAGIDTFGAGQVTADSNLALTDNQAIRVNALVEAIDNHRDFKDGDRWAINPTYTAALSDHTQLVVSWEHVDDDRLVDRGVPSLGGEPLQGYDETYFGKPDFNRTTFEGDIVRARVDHRLSDVWSANATVQFADYDKLYQNLYPIGFDTGAGTVSLDGYRDTTDRENRLIQFNLVGQFATGSIEHTLLAGAEWGRQETANARQDAYFLDSQDDQITFGFTDPLSVPAMTLTDPVRDRGSDVSFTSVFLQDEIALTPHWSLVAGLRWDRFEIDVIDTIEINDGALDGNDGFLSSSDTEISPRAGIIFKPADDLSLYASYSVSFLPRSGDQFLSLSPSSATLAPEEFENLEVGFKWNPNKGLSLSAAAFEITRENGTAVDPANPERSVLTGTETRGLELQVAGTVTEHLTVNASYTYLDGEELGRFSAGRSANRELAQLPDHKLTLWTEFAVAAGWRTALGVIHQTEQYASLSNAVELPSFTRVDAAVFYDISDRLQLQLNVENLLDEDYFPSAHNDNNISVGRPLNARVSARYRF